MRAGFGGANITELGFERMTSPNESKGLELSSALFSAALSLLGILVPLLVGLLAIYDEVAVVSWLADKYNTIIWGILIVILLTGAVAGISLADLSGYASSLTLLATVLMALMIAVILVGSVIWVMNTV